LTYEKFFDEVKEKLAPEFTGISQLREINRGGFTFS